MSLAEYLTSLSSFFDSQICSILAQEWQKRPDKSDCVLIQIFHIQKVEASFQSFLRPYYYSINPFRHPFNLSLIGHQKQSHTLNNPAVTDYEHALKARMSRLFGLNVADKYASAVTKNLGSDCNSWVAGHFVITNPFFIL